MAAPLGQGVAWAFAGDGGRPAPTALIVVIVIEGIIAIHRHNEWRATFHDDCRSVDDEAMTVTAIAELNGMELTAGPMLFDAEPGCTALFAVDRGMKALCDDALALDGGPSTWAALRKAWDSAYRPGAFAGAGGRSPVIGFRP